MNADHESIRQSKKGFFHLLCTFVQCTVNGSSANQMLKHTPNHVSVKVHGDVPPGKHLRTSLGWVNEILHTHTRAGDKLTMENEVC